MTATYTKLKSGDWGIRIACAKGGESTVSAGQRLTVKKKDGSEKAETIDRVLWTGDGIVLAAIKPQSNGSNRGGRVCAECGKGGALVSDMEDGLMKHYRCCDMPPEGY